MKAKALNGLLIPMTSLLAPPYNAPLVVTWEKLPEDFLLPDDPVDNNLQPLLAAALREALELAGLILDSMIIATNFGICATVAGKTVVKAPDWVYVPATRPVPSGTIRRSYTPHLEGEVPSVVMEFISETEGGEYSFNPHYPYGKWFFYEQILKVPVYVIFHPQLRILEAHRLVEGKYQPIAPDENDHVWIEEMNLFLGMWHGKKVEYEGAWLRWWDASGRLLLWGSELLEQERQLAEQERQRAEQERQRAALAVQRAEALAAQLKALGVEPDSLS